MLRDRLFPMPGARAFLLFGALCSLPACVEHAQHTHTYRAYEMRRVEVGKETKTERRRVGDAPDGSARYELLNIEVPVYEWQRVFVGTKTQTYQELEPDVTRSIIMGIAITVTVALPIALLVVIGARR